MYEDLIKRLRNCISDTVEDCAGCPYQGGYKGTYCMNGLISEAADAIEKLSSFKEQITDGRFYVYKLGTLFELRHDPRDFVVEQQSYKEPPKEES